MTQATTHEVNFIPNSKWDFSTKEGKNVYQKEWSRKNRDKCRVWAAAQYQRDPEKIKAGVRQHKAKVRKDMFNSRLFSHVVWSGARARAKEKGLEFSIRREDFLIPEFCPAIGIPLDWSDRNHTPSLDRIDNTKGYVFGNVVVVSSKANTTKRDLTVEELKRMAAFYG